MSALHYFAMENDIEGLRELLREGENPNSQDRTGRTPLHVAVSKSRRYRQDIEVNSQIVRELINFGANVDQTDNLGNTPLQFAVRHRNYEMVKILLQANVKIDKKSRNGYTALHYATTECVERRIAYPSEFFIVKLLLKYHADLNIQNDTNRTPLMLAARDGNFQIVQELLKNGAFVHLRDSGGNTAMHYAIDKPKVNLNVVLEFMSNGCPLLLNNNDFMCPMTTYLHRLLVAPLTEIEKAKYVLKHQVLGMKYFDTYQKNYIIEIDTRRNCRLAEFLLLCESEIEQMQLDELAPNFSVHVMALRGAFYSVSERINDITNKVFDKVLDKLLRHEYPVYSDLIAAGICEHYMKRKFSEMCCNVETGIVFFHLHALYRISFYLSHFDMVNMMIACSECSPDRRGSGFSPDRRNSGCSPGFKCYARCTLL